jgi:hypothetical protein
MDQLVSGLCVGPLGREMELGYGCSSVPRPIGVRCGISVRTSQMMMVGLLFLRMICQSKCETFNRKLLTLDSRMSLSGLMCYVELKLSVR